MSRVTWVQPVDLVAHELVASTHEGKEVDDVRERWRAAGGVVQAPLAGLGVGGAAEDVDDPDATAGASLRELALALIDELDARPADPGLDAREPTALEAVRALLPRAPTRRAVPAGGGLPDRVHGAWLGRAAGCLLGKPVEKLPRHAIREVLQAQGRWPLTTWFTAQGLPADVAARWPWNRASAATSLAENITGMPEDDDLDFCLVALTVLEQHGPAFTTDDVAQVWLGSLPGGRVFTAERLAYRNLLEGHAPPATATRRNPFREWIGAAIRTDVHGWAHPGDPWAAAERAHRDAVLTHVRAGVHGAMAVAAMCAQALVAGDVEEVVAAGLSVVPPQSRYAAALARGAELGRSATALEEAYDALHAEFGHLHWVHVLNNAALLGLALARGRGDLGATITTAVMGGWDTDSTGATAGSVCGALTGATGLDAAWVGPLGDTLTTTVPGFDGASFADLARRTLALVAQP